MHLHTMHGFHALCLLPTLPTVEGTEDLMIYIQMNIRYVSCLSHYVPMTHICVKDERAHLHCFCNSYEGTTASSGLQQLGQSCGYLSIGILSLLGAHVTHNQTPNFARSYTVLPQCTR